MIIPISPSSPNSFFNPNLLLSYYVSNLYINISIFIKCASRDFRIKFCDFRTRVTAFLHCGIYARQSVNRFCGCWQGRIFYGTFFRLNHLTTGASWKWAWPDFQTKTKMSAPTPTSLQIFSNWWPTPCKGVIIYGTIFTKGWTARPQAQCRILF